MERAVALARGGIILPEHLPPAAQEAKASAPYKLYLDDYSMVDLRQLTERFEMDLMQWALTKAGGNQGKAAELLRIPRTTLQSKLGMGRRPEQKPDADASAS
jgi:DNA-binding NtrC family response regulator